MTNDERDLQEDLDHARMLASDGLSAEALIHLRKIVHRTPDCAEAHSLIATLLCNQGIYDEALEAANRTLELDSENSRAQEIKQTCEQAQEQHKPPTVPFSYRPGGIDYKAKKTKVSTRPCPHCGEEIHRGVRLCRHCGAAIGSPKWMRQLSLGVLAVVLLIGIVYFVTSVLGTRSMEPVHFDAQGNRIETVAASETIEDATAPAEPAFRIDHIRWHPGSVIPAPVPADGVDQMYAMSHGATFSGELTNLSDKHLGYALVVAHFYGQQTGNELGAAVQEVYNVTPGYSVPLDFGGRIGNRPGDCEVALVDISYGFHEAAPVTTSSEAEATTFPWLLLLVLFIFSVVLLFGCARLQLACGTKETWDFEIKEDLVASVLMVPVFAICNGLILLLLGGTMELANEGQNLGPIVIFAVVGPFLFMFIAVGFLFKRGFWGTMTIALFYGCIFFLVLGFLL